MGGKRKKRKRPKNNSTKNIISKNPLTEQQEKFNAEELKHLVSKKKIHNFFDSFTDILYGIGKILFLIMLGCGTIGITIFLVWSMYAYFRGEEGVATVTMTIMQALSGLVSVVVGIWALVLTIQADKKKITTENMLNINRTSSDTNVVGVLDSKDVNSKSL